MCIIGASMGGTIVCMFAVKYPEYASMICLLAPIGEIECISEAYVTNYCDLCLW
jgi:homoserine acetyltransferase